MTYNWTLSIEEALGGLLLPSNSVGGTWFRETKGDKTITSHMLFALLWCILLWIITLCLVRICAVIPLFSSSKRHATADADAKDLVLFVFLGSGGHTGEMLRLLDHYQKAIIEGATTIHVGYSDEDSLVKFKDKIGAIVSSKQLQVKIEYHHFKKARDVGSSVAGSVISIIETLITSMTITYNIKKSMRGKPNLTLLNGPGTCCIITVWLKLYHLFLWQPSKIVYVESLARTNRLSLTGKILYALADEFVVQWPDLLPAYPRAKYYGILV